MRVTSTTGPIVDARLIPKIGLFLDANPSDGGAYQFCLTMLHAFSALAPDTVEALVYYTDPVWKPQLQTTGLQVAFLGKSYWTLFSKRRSSAFLPMRLWRRLGRRIHPVAKKMVAAKCDLWFFPAQDTWTYLMPVPAIGVIFDLMHRYERQFPEVGIPRNLLQPRTALQEPVPLVKRLACGL